MKAIGKLIFLPFTMMYYIMWKIPLFMMKWGAIAMMCLVLFILVRFFYKRNEEKCQAYKDKLDKYTNILKQIGKNAIKSKLTSLGAKYGVEV